MIQEQMQMISNDDPKADRENARTALIYALAAAREDNTQKADSLTRIADAHIRMSTIHRDE